MSEGTQVNVGEVEIPESTDTCATVAQESDGIVHEEVIDTNVSATTEPTRDNNPIPTPSPRARQFLLLADEATMVMMGKLVPNLLFVEVEGLQMTDKPGYMLLANPMQRDEA